EMESINYIILMTSVADNKEAFTMLSNALKTIDGRLKKINNKSIKKPPIPKLICKSSDVKNTVKTPIENSIGLVCGEYVYAYPPDIPIIVPGELIEKEIIENITEMINSGINIISDSNLLPHYILTKAD
ncbi:MAG: hypothetical protein K2G22_02650, partial [Eubacterium sp.]|nr:hypothetical protein [Eubacterium sp.]